MSLSVKLFKLLSPASERGTELCPDLVVVKGPKGRRCPHAPRTQVSEVHRVHRIEERTGVLTGAVINSCRRQVTGNKPSRAHQSDTFADERSFHPKLTNATRDLWVKTARTREVTAVKHDVVEEHNSGKVRSFRVQGGEKCDDANADFKRAV
jgi:hypothetical protein